MQPGDSISVDAPVKQALKTIAIAFLSALSGAALSTAIVGGVLLNRVATLEQADKDQISEIKRIDKDGSQKMQQYAVELAGFKLQYAEFSARQIVQIEKLARIETVLERLDRNTP
jgi:hypothetical protein